MIIRFLFILCVSVLFSCKKTGCFKSEGKQVKINRNVDPFSEIWLYDNVNLILTQDSTEKMMVEAGENIQSDVEVQVTGGILSLKYTAKCSLFQSPAARITVYLSVKNLRKIKYFGSGMITCTNTITGKDIEVESVNGAGNITLTLDNKKTVAVIHEENADLIFNGYSDSCYTRISSRGSIDFRNFQVKRFAIDYESVRNGYIHVTEALHATIRYKGNLYYKGSPALINIKASSSGKLIQF